MCVREKEGEVTVCVTGEVGAPSLAKYFRFLFF